MSSTIHVSARDQRGCSESGASVNTSLAGSVSFLPAWEPQPSPEIPLYSRGHSDRTHFTGEGSWALEPTPAWALCGLDELLHLSEPRPLGIGTPPSLSGRVRRGWPPGVGATHWRPLFLLSGPRIYSCPPTALSFLSTHNPVRLPWRPSLSRGYGSGMCRNSLPVLPRNRQTTVAKDRLRVSPIAQDPSARCSGPWPLPELREALPSSES